MAFDDDNFFDDYEIQELVDKFEFQLENDNISFYDIDDDSWWYALSDSLFFAKIIACVC